MLETSLDRQAVPTRLGQIVDWFKARERLLLIIGATAQVVVLVGMIAMRSIPFFGAKVVLLQVQPVDPRDMFRGDYVTLSYEFNRFPPNGLPGISPTWNRNASAQNQGRAVYVALVPEADGLHYKAGSYGLTPPTSGLYLRGTLTGWNQIQFGIENYYVQEGTGHKYEEAIRSRRLWAEVAVAPDGQAALKGLRIE
ncbi:MAG TPA: GDYXXLXY domain-containing protein [Planctomycetaceae bacterium]|jgi:uncharacterized membrane-anchored protein|nr:GDYXXLXY domain-containing protein [Planctomycetaceae bacterium]